MRRRSPLGAMRRTFCIPPRERRKKGTEWEETGVCAECLETAGVGCPEGVWQPAVSVVGCERTCADECCCMPRGGAQRRIII